MTYFAIISRAKEVKVNFEVSEVLITHVTYRGKAEVMLHIGAGQSNNYQIILLNCSDMTYFAIICSAKKFKVNLDISEVFITDVSYRGKARVMLHIGAGQSNNHQTILKLFRYDMVCKKGLK